jgi:glucokinase
VDIKNDPVNAPSPRTGRRVSGSSSTRKPARASNWSGVLAEQGYVVGVDVSAGGERVVLSDLDGSVIARDAHLHKDSDSHSPQEVVQRVTSMIKVLLEAGNIRNREVLRIGVGFGGPVDASRGLVRRSYVMPGWNDYPLAAEIERALDVPTLLDNDSRLAALGEVWFGVGRDKTSCDLVYLHWSTGVGGGIVSENRLLRGSGSLAGEIGHLTVRMGPDALPCRCGGRGHLEAYVRSEALISRARSLDPHSGIGSIEALFTRANNDSALRAFVDEALDLIAFSVGNLITATNPDVVVIGGRVARECETCIPRIANMARIYAMPLSSTSIEIVPAELGENSGVMGAVALGLESLN